MFCVRSRGLGVFLGVGVLAVACQHFNFGRGDSAPPESTACLSSADKLKEKKFGIEADLEERLKAVLSSALFLEETGEKLDDRFADICVSLARELGVKKPDVKAQGELGKRTELACKKAIDELTSIKQKSGVSMTVDAKEFTCGVRPDEFGSCAKQCDINLPPGNIELGCGENQLKGRCSGKCTGQCGQVNTPDCASTCLGECGGVCQEGFYGKCGGKCIGTCDMSNVNGKCEGNCEGKCLSDAQGTCEGTCKGKCTGSCVQESKGKSCDGTCRGECDGTMSSAICGEVLPPPEMTPECVAMCTAKMTSKLQCSSDHVGVTLFRADKEADGKRVQGAMSRRMKEILEIGDGMKTPLEDAATRVADALAAIESEVADDKEVKKAVGSCIDEANAKREAAAAGFAKFAETSAALFEATRN